LFKHIQDLINTTDRQTVKLKAHRPDAVSRVVATLSKSTP